MQLQQDPRASSSTTTCTSPTRSARASRASTARSSSRSTARTSRTWRSVAERMHGPLQEGPGRRRRRRSSAEMGLPLVEIKIDRDGVARYGIPIQQVQNTINSAVTGAPATTFYEDDQTYPVVTRLEQKYRNTIDAASTTILVAAPSGSLIPLAAARDGRGRRRPAAHLARQLRADHADQVQRRRARAGRRGRGVPAALRQAEIKPTLRPGYFVTVGGRVRARRTRPCGRRRSRSWCRSS